MRNASDVAVECSQVAHRVRSDDMLCHSATTGQPKGIVPGPIFSGYYAATESIGPTVINSERALQKPGSVGRDGVEGMKPLFERYKSEATIQESRQPDHPDAWATIGDMGYLDEEGFLCIVERAIGLITTGGVTIRRRSNMRWRCCPRPSMWPSSDGPMTNSV